MNIALELLKFFPVISVLSRNGRGEGMGEGVGRRGMGKGMTTGTTGEDG